MNFISIALGTRKREKREATQGGEAENGLVQKNYAFSAPSVAITPGAESTSKTLVNFITIALEDRKCRGGGGQHEESEPKTHKYKKPVHFLCQASL